MMDILQSNLRFLSEYNEPLIEKILEADASEVECLRVQDEAVFKLQDDAGLEYYTASIYDPLYEADAFLEGVNMDNTGFIVMGAGNPAILKRILEQKTETAWLFIVERDIRLLRKVFEETDFAPYLEGKLQRMVFFCGDDQEVMQHLFLYFNSLVGYYFAQTEILRTFATWRSHKAFYDSMFHYIGDEIKFYISNAGNSIQDTLIGIGNELTNLKPILTSKRLHQLKDQYKDRPIICVSSGPSLDKQLPLLQEAQGKSVIIAAATAMRVLLKNGIVPDIVCILERGRNAYELPTAGLDIPEEVTLFGLTLIDPEAYRDWPNRSIPCFKQNIANSRFLHEALEEPFGDLYSGNSVAHLNLALAEYLGGSPIVLIGQDLAYSDEGTTHSKHTIYHEEQPEGVDDSQLTRAKNSLSNEKSNFNKVVYLEGYYGGQVKSRELWRQFHAWIELMIQTMRLESRMINATEGGANIKGTQKVPFADVVKTYCQEPVLPVWQAIDQLPQPDVEPAVYLQRVYNHFQRFIDRVQELADSAQENLDDIAQVLDDIEAGRHGDLESKSAKVLSRTERILIRILEDQYVTFYFRPLIVNMHVKINPIARISSIERLKKILGYQQFFLKRLIEGKEDFDQVFTDSFGHAAGDFGLTLEDF